MARIAGVDLPREKAILYALPLIYGVGKHNASKIIEQAGLDPTVKVKDLSETDVAHLREILDRDFQVEGDLRREVNANIRRLIEIGSYRGLRHRRNFPPVRGLRGVRLLRILRIRCRCPRAIPKLPTKS